MEEKANFKYDATIKISPTNLVDDTPVEDYRILQMAPLSPMSVQWQKRNGERGKLCVYLDFVNEKVYDGHLNIIPGNLGEAILLVLKQNKAKAMPELPDAVWKALEIKQKVYEGRPDGTVEF